MKKFKLLSGFLAIALCIGLLSIKASASEVTTPIEPTSIVNGDENTAIFTSYDYTIPVVEKSLVVPINMNYKGQLIIDLTGQDVPSYIDITLYSDEAYTGKIGYSGYISSTLSKDTMKLDIPKKGTYYLKFELSSYAESDAKISIVPYSYNSEDRSLTNNTWVVSHPYSYDSETYYEIKASKPGYITMEGYEISDLYSVTVTLCNSNKKELSPKTYMSSSNNFTTYFAVKKGTYYIKAVCSDNYKLRYKFTAVNENSKNKSKSKAATIGKGKTAKGLILSEDSTSKVDWYKVKITKKQKLILDVTAKSCDSIQFEIIPASSKVILYGSSFRLYDGEGGTYSTKDSLPVGTYYIKVTKTNKTCSGTYSIKFK